MLRRMKARNSVMGGFQESEGGVARLDEGSDRFEVDQGEQDDEAIEFEDVGSGVFVMGESAEVLNQRTEIGTMAVVHGIDLCNG